MTFSPPFVLGLWLHSPRSVMADTAMRIRSSGLYASLMRTVSTLSPRFATRALPYSPESVPAST